MNSRNLPSTSFALTMVQDLRRMLFSPLLAAAFLAGVCQPGLAQYEALDLVPEQAAPTLPAGGATLFLNVRIFDGKNAALSAPSSVLVRGNIIEQISVGPAATAAGADVRVINANGRVLMPGLIDAHWHMFTAAVSPAILATADPGYLNLLAARQADATLMRGFTTIRDMGGPVFGLKRAIDDRGARIPQK
jgi:imidazolonepropionase-like amidohydrolase